MKWLHDINPRSAVSVFRPRSIGLVMGCVLITFAFALSACGGNLTPTATTDLVTHTSASASPTSYPVKVFLSKFPESVSTNLNAVYPVDRLSPTVAVGTFAIQLLIAGPTLSEQHAGYFTELNTMLNGPSNCSAPIPVGGPDFVLTLNMKGPVPESGTATVKFCRSLTSAGIGADARVQAQITATLKQFHDIKKVVILTKDGHCFADESGKDFCLR